MTDNGAIATETDAMNCYRILLGREQENPAIVQRMVVEKRPIWEYIRTFQNSPEAAVKSMVELG